MATRSVQIFSPQRVERMLNRMAYEVIERNRGAGNLLVIGIKRKGVAIAQAIAARIEAAEGVSLPVTSLDVASFRDDREEVVRGEENLPPIEVTGKDILLVDDVLFTGRTVRAALDAIVQFGRPRTIQLAVLIDRGHREYPIQPDYVGRRLVTKYREHVQVETTPPFRVYLVEPLLVSAS